MSRDDYPSDDDQSFASARSRHDEHDDHKVKPDVFSPEEERVGKDVHMHLLETPQC